MAKQIDEAGKYGSIEHKAAIDAFLIRWDEKPCRIDEALHHLVHEPEMTPQDCADAIMCSRA